MNFTDCTYIPLLAVRPAEMKALEELPAKAKNSILPYVVLKPWASSSSIDSTIARVNAAVGDRKLIADITLPFPFKGKRRPVHDTFDALRNSANGFQNYIDLLHENENFIPSLQLTDLSQLEMQIKHIDEINRGVAIRLHEPMLKYAGNIAAKISERFNGDNVHFILDFEKQNKDLLLKATVAEQAVKAIRAYLPDCSLSFSASSFPDSFVTLQHQEIFERQFFQLMQEQVGALNTIYCDRGSARAEALGGGGGTPAPRIDLANINRWDFFRVDDQEDKVEGFRKAAKKAVESAHWIDHGIWGSEYIKNTVDKDETNIIDSATKCTSARINIHLYIQANNGEVGSCEVSEWSD